MENHFENIDKSIIKTLAVRLEEAKTKEEAGETLKRILFFLESILNVKLSGDVNKAYKTMREEGLLLRCESLSRIFESIVDHKPIRLGDKEDHYANAVVPELEGVKIAFGEGGAPGPVRLIIGFDVKSAIGFNPENLTVSRIEKREEDLRDFEFRNYFCRHVSGDLTPESIKYLIMRMPRSLFPEEYLEEEEKEENLSFVFRAGKLFSA